MFSLVMPMSKNQTIQPRRKKNGLKKKQQEYDLYIERENINLKIDTLNLVNPSPTSYPSLSFCPFCD